MTLSTHTTPSGAPAVNDPSFVSYAYRQAFCFLQYTLRPLSSRQILVTRYDCLRLVLISSPQTATKPGDPGRRDRAVDKTDPFVRAASEALCAASRRCGDRGRRLGRDHAEREDQSLLPSHLSFLLAEMVSKNVAVYEPPKQTRAVLLYWRLPEEWAEALHEWAVSTGQLNTILTFYEIIEPPVPSPLSGIPITLLRKAVSILTKANRAQIIAVADGEGVRLLAGSTGK